MESHLPLPLQQLAQFWIFGPVQEIWLDLALLLAVPPCVEEHLRMTCTAMIP